MKYKCEHCDTVNVVPDDREATEFNCYECQTRLTGVPATDGSTSAAVGLIGGAALGASIGGPAGAVIGGIIGALLGKESKGVG